LSSQLTARFGGVIPSFAMRNHTIDVPFVVETSLKQANLESFDQVDAVAVTNRPGLTGSLLIGTRYAQYLCHKHKKRQCFI
jgi:N6-L-threonylcarbamoyladenine synthase